MSIATKPNFLRTILLFDAATCAVIGAALALASGPIARFTYIPPSLLFYAGLSLFPIAAFIAIVVFVIVELTGSRALRKSLFGGQRGIVTAL